MKRQGKDKPYMEKIYANHISDKGLISKNTKNNSIGRTTNQIFKWAKYSNIL